MRWLLALALLPGLTWADSAPDGRSIVLHGNANGALPCAACHGVDGMGKPAIGAPALAGIPAPVIEAYLAGLVRGNGGGIMTGIAQSLSPAEVKAVAAYFASLPGPLSPKP